MFCKKVQKPKYDAYESGEKDMMLRNKKVRNDVYELTINSLTAMVSYMRPLFNVFRHCLITFRFFVRSQRLIARNVANGLLFNRGVSHCDEACRINDVSRGSLSDYDTKIDSSASFKKYDNR